MPSTSTSSEQQFRESLRSFRWASNSSGTSTTKSTTPLSRLTETTSNFFGSVGNRMQGYVPLTGNAEQEEGWFTLTRWQRLTGFAVCLATAALCFIISSRLQSITLLRLVANHEHDKQASNRIVVIYLYKEICDWIGLKMNI
ncbi:2416_t:CDS:2 [Paraglomus occultum]|uniref:2416_t:CDS:1 n=1 Tax=Paraglomus occultum TaxID=144539 RepID=A0A9N8ZZF7_9GLOM|nr:2416_t:CDS:2 [Paraglomus occultum]